MKEGHSTYFKHTAKVQGEITGLKKSCVIQADHICKGAGLHLEPFSPFTFVSSNLGPNQTSLPL